MGTCTLPVLDTISKFGSLISGISLFLGACAAWITLFVIHRRQMQLNWLDGFRLLYAEYWKDDEIATVRSWIVSDNLYKDLEQVLAKRLQSISNTLDSENNKKLEKIDRFCALLIRLDSFDKTGMTAKQRNLWQNIYGTFWINKIRERRALAEYIVKYWSPLRGFFLDLPQI